MFLLKLMVNHLTGIMIRTIYNNNNSNNRGQKRSGCFFTYQIQVSLL